MNWENLTVDGFFKTWRDSTAQGLFENPAPRNSHK